MENLEVKVKELVDENERLKGENTKLLTRVHTLEMEVCNKNDFILNINKIFSII
jgi:regulator of replication initiation timing